MMETTVFLGTFNTADMFWYLSPDLCLDPILSRSSTEDSFNLVAWVWLYLSTVEPYIGHELERHTPVYQFNLPQVDSNQVVETSRMINKNRT
jgi:hypothetical protein